MLLLGITIAIFGAGMVVMAAGARQVFAMARDQRFPAARVMSRVNPRTQTPLAATVLIVVVGGALLLALPGQALIQLIVAGTILPALIYGGVVVLYLVVRGRLERREGGFSLGRAELPVSIAALIWVVLALVVLVTPAEAKVPVLIVGGLLILGALYFAKLMVFDRAVLMEEPDAGDAVLAIDDPEPST